MNDIELKPLASVDGHQAHCVDVLGATRQLAQSTILCEQHEAPDAIEQMRAEGVEFRTSVEVGKTVAIEMLLAAQPGIEVRIVDGTYDSLMRSLLAADIKERTFKFSYVQPKESHMGFGAQKFADLVSKKSGGKLTVRVFPNGTLGGDLQTVSALQGGTLEMVTMNSGILANQVKEFAIYDFPFMFGSETEADAVLDGKANATQELTQAVAAGEGDEFVEVNEGA